ncbi:alpha/beta fold hydrolase [Actinoplanes oblitus]|uniref:Alpha/beta fold hydrolase n=1 Tax=Actinoplanes oblitus TaxID=3040509 RepID=A0ABY8WDD6_9ACTN|nr:alpha/beta fold hydrolase [Actinoplanes oblitus]WIM94409.1 alpha/beta fold hydrolase [Actinoplanes oblitus]
MTRWTVRRLRRPDAAVTLYCFPHAGGSPGEYVRWSDDLPEFQVWGVHLPGRTTRAGEPPYTEMASLVRDLVAAVPFAERSVFLGHSLGALVAFETARELRRRGRPQPEGLIVSSCPAPPYPERGESLSALADDELLGRATELWGLPAADLSADPALQAHALACLRNDLALLENYRYRPEEPLDAWLHVLRGDREPTRADAPTWRAQTRGPIGETLLPGGHFYFREQRHETLRAVRETVLTRGGRQCAE